MGTNRIYSGFYDTVKQKELYERDKHDVFKQDYSDIFKLQVLFIGKLVITDAQYFDGLFIHSMLDYEFEDFIKFAAENDILEIKVRDNYIQDIFGKSFRFSSILDNTLADKISNIGAEIKESKIEFSSLDEYFEVLEKLGGIALKSIEFEKFKINLMNINNLGIKYNIFKLWLSDEDIENNNIENIPKIMEKEKENLKELASKIPNNQNRNNIINEINKNYPNYPNRTIIYNNCELNSSNNKSIHSINFWDYFTRIYNKGIAQQHECNIFENQFINSKKLNAKKIHQIQFNISHLNELLNMDWKDLSNLYKNKNLTNQKTDTFNCVKKKNPTLFFEKLQKAINDIGISNNINIIEDNAFEDNKLNIFGISCDDSTNYLLSISNRFEKLKERFIKWIITIQ